MSVQGNGAAMAANLDHGAPRSPENAEETSGSPTMVEQGGEVSLSSECDETDVSAGCAGSVFCHPEARCHRIIALALMCSIGFGSYFCYDNPGALQEEIRTTMHVSTLQFETLYALYSWPNVFLPVAGGILIDRVFGIRWGAIIFASFICFGQGLTALGAYLNSYFLMESSRFIFGIGGESLAVAQNTYASSWFSGELLNMVFGLQLSFSRVGSTANFQCVGPLFASLKQTMSGNNALATTLAIAGLTTIMSLLCCLVLGVLDKRRSVLLHQETAKNPEVHWRDLLRFPMEFWLLSVICVAYYVAVFPFVTLGQVFYMKKFNFSTSNANFINGLVYLMSAFAAPALGLCIDRIGRNVTFVLISVVLTIFSHGLLAFTEFNPYFAIVLMGLGYSLLAASLWPIVSLVVPLHRQGTAFGLVQAVQNLGLAAISSLAGLVVDKYGYMWLEIFFLCFLMVALMASTALWVVDFWGSRHLNMSVSQRKIYEASPAYQRLHGLQDEDNCSETSVHSNVTH